MPRLVPSITQYASPTLIAEIAYRGHPAIDDPRWAQSGAPDAATYARWCGRWCGAACLRMALLARDGQAPTLHELAQDCLAYGAYTDEPDRPRGLIYRPFVRYVREQFAVQAEVVEDLDARRLAAELDRGMLVIASVHPEIRRPHFEAPGVGGHLVLVTGHTGGEVNFNDPAGHTPRAVTARLPIAVFDAFSARRGIVLSM